MIRVYLTLEYLKIWSKLPFICLLFSFLLSFFFSSLFSFFPSNSIFCSLFTLFMSFSFSTFSTVLGLVSGLWNIYLSFLFFIWMISPSSLLLFIKRLEICFYCWMRNFTDMWNYNKNIFPWFINTKFNKQKFW